MDLISIHDLWTMPLWHNQGLGTRLIRGLLHLGRQDGVEVATVSVNEPNHGARLLYERLGFVVRYCIVI